MLTFLQSPLELKPEEHEHWAVDAYFERWKNDLASFRTKVELLKDGEPQLCRPTNDERQYSCLGVHRQTEIPTSLLSGPWTEQNIELLFWLVRGGAMIDYSNSSAGEV